MKKRIETTSQIVNSRIILKTGSVLFLSAFVFCSLAAPIAAQFGSVLFIALGMLLAPFAQGDTPQEHTMTPPPSPTVYIECSLQESRSSYNFQETFSKPRQLPLQFSAITAKNSREILFNPETEYFHTMLQHATSLWLLYTCQPVRAGPDHILS